MFPTISLSALVCVELIFNVAGRCDPIVDHALKFRIETEATAALVELDPGEAAIELLIQECLRRRRRRWMRLEQVGEQIAHPLFVRGQGAFGRGHGSTVLSRR